MVRCELFVLELKTKNPKYIYCKFFVRMAEIFKNPWSHCKTVLLYKSCGLNLCLVEGIRVVIVAIQPRSDTVD
jgi:hypothetical protein